MWTVFFIFDAAQQCFLLRVPDEYSRYKRLCRQLYQGILHTRSVLQPAVWSFILNTLPPTED